MSWVKDLKSKPKKNRFFPIRFGDAIREVKSLEFKQYSGDRIAIRMENVEGEFESGFPLFDYVPEEELAIFSLDESLEPEIARKATLLALMKVSKLKVKPKDHVHNSYFSVYIDSENKILIQRVDRAVKLKRYRGDDKLKNANYVGSTCKRVILESFDV